jgi:hypothetical protein
VKIDGTPETEEVKSSTPIDAERSSIALEGGYTSMHTISVGGSVLDYEPIERPESSVG